MMNVFFLRILVTNLRALCFDIYAIPTTCVHRIIKVDSILYQKYAFWTHLFGMRCHCYILVGIINWEFQLKYVDIVISKVYNLNKHFFLFFFLFLVWLKLIKVYYKFTILCTLQSLINIRQNVIIRILLQKQLPFGNNWCYLNMSQTFASADIY